MRKKKSVSVRKHASRARTVQRNALPGAASLGSQIRQLRKAKGLTLEQLAASIDKSIGFVSQVERDLVKPSVSTLEDISQALGMHIGWFFPETRRTREEERGYVVRSQHRRPLMFTSLTGSEYLGVSDFLLSPGLSGAMAIGMSVYRPGATTGDDAFRRTEGEVIGLVVRGRLDIWIQDQHLELEEGDCYQVPATLPRRIENSSSEEAALVWIVTPVGVRF